MKWHHTLFFKITLIFSISFIAILGIGAIFTKSQNDKILIQSKRTVYALLRSAHDNSTNTFDKDFLEQEGISIIEDITPFESYIPSTMSERVGHTVHRGMGRRRGPIIVFDHEGTIFAFALPHEKEPILFKTSFTHSINLHILLFTILLSLLAILYFFTIRSIRPLKPLRKSIEAFALGDHATLPMSKSYDEIGALINAYNKTVLKTKQLKESRQLFLRNIMHELKTPLTKAKLALAMIKDSSYKSKLEVLLKTQEGLLDEFARIEKLGAGELSLNLKTYHIDDILAQVRDLLPEEEPNLSLEVKSGFLNVDFDLFCVALKNILDNALRYSDDKKAKIYFDGKTINIQNFGVPLAYSLEEYAKPYFLGEKKQKESRGLGFGLFIALRVFELHNFVVTYSHKNGESKFTIIF